MPIDNSFLCLNQKQLSSKSNNERKNWKLSFIFIIQLYLKSFPGRSFILENMDHHVNHTLKTNISGLLSAASYCYVDCYVVFCLQYEHLLNTTCLTFLDQAGFEADFGFHWLTAWSSVRRRQWKEVELNIKVVWSICLKRNKITRKGKFKRM